MKKSFRTIACLIAVMGLAVACNNNNQPAEVIDTVIAPIDTVVAEPVDTVVVEEVVAEEPVKQAPAKKKATTKKKEEPKLGESVTTKDGVVISTAGATMKVGTKDGKFNGETSVTTKDGVTIETTSKGKLKKKE
jgi:hypothetical protein